MAFAIFLFMPFNKEGEWVTLNPLDTYRDFVKRSQTSSGSGGAAWNSAARNRLHDAATRFVMERDGILSTEDNFYMTREIIGRELEENFDHAERSGLISRSFLVPDKGSELYKRYGD